MNKVLYIILISLFSLTVISCGSSSDGGSSTTSTTTDNDTTTTDNTTTTTDTTAPVIAEVTAVTTPTNDTTPDYTFSSSEAGTITYGGSCSSSTNSAIIGDNTITFAKLSDELTYSDCTITVTDSAGNVSNTLEINSFTVDTSPGVFVGVGYSGTGQSSSAFIIKSLDNGSSFDNVSINYSHQLRAIAHGNGTFYAVGGGSLISKDNGTTWDNKSRYPGDYGITFAKEMFVTVENQEKVKICDDNGSSCNAYNYLTNIYGGSIYSNSPNGIYALWGISFGNNTLVVVGDNGTISRSTDRIITCQSFACDAGNGSSMVDYWDNSTNRPTSENLYSISFGNSTFVSVGDNGTIIKSTDNGFSWDNVTSPTTNRLKGVGFGNSVFVAVGYSGNILRSTDNGSSWDNVTSPTTNRLESITFGNGTFVVVGHNGTILSSSDNGSSFDNSTSPIGTNLTIRGVTF